MAYSPSLSYRPPLFTLRTVTSTSVFFPPSSVKISFASYPCQRTRLRLPNSYTVPRFRVTCGAGIAEINETQFSDTVLKADRPVLVEFVANWCGPCRLISPIMEWAAQEYGDRLTVVKIDHDANPKLIEEFKVYGLPTLILFKNGQEVPASRREGAITKVKLKEHLDALLNSMSYIVIFVAVSIINFVNSEVRSTLKFSAYGQISSVLNSYVLYETML